MKNLIYSLIFRICSLICLISLFFYFFQGNYIFFITSFVFCLLTNLLSDFYD